MKTLHAMSPERLDEIIAGFSNTRIAVLGDFFLDKYLDVDPSLAEKSVETGKTAHQVVGVRSSPGAAGTVVSNLASLGAGQIHAVGFTGDDGESFELRRALESLRCDVEHLHVAADRHTPVYFKPRDRTDASLAGEHSRYDIKNRTPVPEAVQQQIVGSLDALLPRIDAVIVADQVEEEDCGAVTSAVRRAVADRAVRHPKVVFWADSRRRIRQFRRVMIKPNQFEAAGRDDPAPGDRVPLDELAAAVGRLRRQMEAPVCATCGADGLIVSDPEMTLIPGVEVEGPIDPTGAGDSVTAAAVLALAAGASFPEAALVGNLVASITIQQLAVTGTASPEQLRRQLQTWLAQR